MSERPAMGDSEAFAASLELAAERGGDLTPRVYERLFAANPALVPLFWRDTNGAIKGEMLMQVFDALADLVGERRYAEAWIQGEILTHEGYDVPRDVFPTFFRLVHATVREACAEGWTPAMEGAWTRVLAEVDCGLAAAG